MRVREVNEGTSMVIDWTLLDDGVPSSPTTARYRIECLTTRRNITDWTTVTPAAVLSIPVSPDENAIQNQKNVKETKQMVLQTNYDTSTQAVLTQRWNVLNIQGIT